MPEPLEKALEDIRREAIESRNLVIKTDNQLKTLHAELKLISKHNEDFQKRWFFGSAAAYVLFAGLCGFGAYALSGARASGEKQERERAEARATEQTSIADKLKADSAAQASQDRSAADVYHLMTTLQGDERIKGVEAYAKLDTKKLSPFARQVLDDRATAIRHEIAAASLERGRTAFRKADYPGAVNELNRFMAMNPDGDDAVEGGWYLGNSLVQTHKNDEAIPYLARYVKEATKAKNRDFAMWLLVQAYDATGQRDKGTELDREALAQYPNSDFIQGFRNRLRASSSGAGGAAPAAPAPAADGGH